MSAEYAPLPPNRAKWLKNAISQMNGLMVDNLWLSETNLSLLSGQKVFRRMEFVSQALMIQDASRKSGISKEMLEAWIQRLVNTARILAVIEINEAHQAGASPSHLDRATQKLSEGDLEKSRARFYRALRKYGAAWSSAAQLILKETRNEQ